MATTRIYRKKKKVPNRKLLIAGTLGIVAIGASLGHARTGGRLDQLAQGWRQAAGATEQPRGIVPAALATRIASLGVVFGDGVSISVRDIDRGWSAGYIPDRLCPQQSVSKLWVAISIFDAIDRGVLTLDTPVTVTKNDLTLFHQPIRALVGAEGYQTTVRGLLERAMTQSDNTANDSLLRTVGGPNAIRSTLSRKNIDHVRFGPGERLLQSGIAGVTWRQSFASGGGFEAARAQLAPDRRRAALDAYVADPMDGAAPAAITSALARLVRGDLLSERSTDDLLALMGRSKTGHARLRSAVEPGWQIAHKTGTGQQLGRLATGFNDVGLLTAPDGHTYAVAVMVARSDRPIAERQRIIADVARAVIDNWNTEKGYASRAAAPVYRP